MGLKNNEKRRKIRKIGQKTVDFSSSPHSEMSKMPKKWPNNGQTVAKNGGNTGFSISSVYGGILRKTEAVATLIPTSWWRDVRQSY